MAQRDSAGGTDGTTAGSGDIARSLELLWGTGDRPARGPRPALTLDRIVTAAVEIADAEGLAALSMRRLATDLGTGTMSLYRYVPGKAELLDLMLDHVLGESPAVPDGTAGDEPADWRAALGALARSYLEQLRRHPWLLKVNQARTVLGPNAVRGLERALGGIRGMGLSDAELISTIITVNSFVEGIARARLHTSEASRETGLSDDDFWENQRPYLERAMLSGDYPLMAALSDDAFDYGTDHFAFGLQRLIDGFEVLVERRSGKRRSAE
ncbi:TetR/AcrR family transcriptional regulator [Streptomyces sp. NPDC032161]|uniref:TetR/AcrR family transcriptional regulator n=1 Tax=unclassified Streptomyces TaxID=2593676 RepID=UPI0033CE05AA